MKYNCMIVDDEEHARNLLRHHIEQLDNFRVVAECESAIEANKMLKQFDIQILFLDIEMPVLKGTDFAKMISGETHIIFTTAHRDYAIEGFDLNALDFLLKPITFARFYQSIEKFLALQQSIVTPIKVLPNIDDYIIIKKDKKHIKLKLNDIIYIESLKDYITIHLKEEEHTIKQTLSSFLSELNTDFLRVHRSFIINKTKVTAISKFEIEINTLAIPIGESYRIYVNEFFKNWK